MMIMTYQKILSIVVLLLGIWIATTKGYHCNPKCQSGDCVAYLGELSCQCYGNWTGDACDQFVCETANPCLNSGVCGVSSTDVSKYVCSCPLGYTGNRCQHKIPDGNTQSSTNCTANVCGPHAVCYDTWEDPKGYYCDCHPGYFGPHCNFTSNHCLNIDCNGNGFCRIIVDGKGNPLPWCTCYGFYGAIGGQATTHCKYPDRYDECHPSLSTCKNGGKCTLVDYPEAYTCTCPPTHHGKNCEIPFDVCEANEPRCLNGGVCVPDGHYFTCTCPLNYTGEKCETAINPCKNTLSSPQSSPQVDYCANTPCSSHTRKCVNGASSYYCECEDGWGGKKCDMDIDECFMTKTPCDQSQTCVNVPGNFMCV